MTIETWQGPLRYTVQGTGPYAIEWPYAEGSIGVFVIGPDGSRDPLPSADWAVTPEASDLRGDLTLSAAAALLHAGHQIVIRRTTTREQGWAGILGERERGLENQLDILTMSLQEVAAEIAGSVRFDQQVSPIALVPGMTIAVGPDGSLGPGPSVSAIAGAEAAATRAVTAARDAEKAAVTGNAFWFADLDSLLASSVPIDVGTIVGTRAEGYSYEAVPAPVIPDFTTAGGAGLRLLPMEGKYDFVAAGGDRSGSNHAVNLATLNRLLSRLDPLAGGIIHFPAGEYALQGAAINQHGVVLQGSPGSVIKKTASNTVPITVGDATRAQGDRVRGFRALDLQLDGGSHQDTSDDYPGIYCRYVEDAVVERCNPRNFWGAGVRFGRGSLAWPVLDQQCRYVRAINNLVQNCGFGIECHGVFDATVALNTIEGGDLTHRSVCIGIRVVKGTRVTVAINTIDRMGRGIATSADAAGQQQFHLYIGNTVTNCSYGPAFSASGEITRLRVLSNTLIGAGSVQTQVCIVDSNGLGTITNFAFEGNHVEATRDSTTDLLRFDGVRRATIKVNSLLHIGTGASGNRYGIRAVACDGLVDISSNTLEMDGPAARGIWDVSGLATLIFQVSDNTILMDVASGTVVNAIAQSSSAGTRRVGVNRFPNVGEYQTRTADSGFSLAPFLSPPTTYFTGALAGPRQISLATTTAHDGLEFTVVHRGSGNNFDFGGLKTLVPNSWATVQFAGAAWVLKASGTM